MTASEGVDNRDIVPRWRAFGSTLRTGELSTTHPIDRAANDVEPQRTLEAETAFRAHPGSHTAGDLLAQAITSGRFSDVVKQAAEFVLSQEGSSPALRQLASASREPGHGEGTLPENPLLEASAQLRANSLRKSLVRDPRNTVRWVDLALCHVNLGQISAAGREIRVALGLAPDNRFVLRSAARFYLLTDEPDRAHWVLRRSPALKVDPWIQAAEIAVSQIGDFKAESMRAARHTLAAAKVHPLHLSELAGELATAELRAGKIKPARRLIAAALQNPTENVIAQAEWVSQQGVGEVPRAQLSLPESFEARALHYGERGDYRRAVTEALNWQADQPFAPEPGIHISYLATVTMDEFDLAARAARRALISNPGHVLLRNNLIFALASGGYLADAERELALVSRERAGDHRATLEATEGLVMYRRGQIVEGRKRYESAIDTFARRGQLQRVALAKCFMAREELLAGTPQATKYLEGAVNAVRRSPSMEAESLLGRIAALLAGRKPRNALP